MSNWLPGLEESPRASQGKVRPSLRLDPLIERSALHLKPNVEKKDVRQILTTQVPSPEYPLTKVYSYLLQDFLTEFGHRNELLEQLNKTRRESLAQYLGFLNVNREIALQVFWKEICFVWLMKATLLKRWSDLGLREWNAADLKDLNFSLSRALRPLLPTDRKECLITQSSFYSWLVPSQELRSKVHETLSGISFTDETFESWVSATLPTLNQIESYDPHCLKALLSTLFSDAQVKQVFSPTLRTGEIIRAFPKQAQWVGLEQSAFLILIAETYKLWEKPSSPPLWEIGSGVDWLKHPNQLGLKLGAPILQTKDKILEIESFDLSIVVEESITRASGKSLQSMRLKYELENGAFSKHFRGSNISVGHMQTLLALSKLRPGGSLIWLRDERLGEHEPQPGLKELLGNSLLVKEWDLSQMQIDFHSKSPALPKYIYLFKREINADLKKANRPERIQAKGALRSHIEVPYFLNDLFAEAVNSEHSESTKKWEIQRLVSPIPQLDWEQKWPEPNCMQNASLAQKISRNSLPLGSLVSIKHIGIEKSTVSPSLFDSGHPAISTDANSNRLLLSHQFNNQSNRLSVVWGSNTEAFLGGFLIHTPNPQWRASLYAYLSSPAVTNWLDHHVEQKQGRWILKEHHIKQIPVPKIFAEVFREPLNTSDLHEPELETALKNVIFNPDVLLELCKNQMRDGVNLQVYAHVSVMLADHESCLKPYTDSIKRDGSFRWSKLIKLLPQQDLVPWHLHPEVRVSGSLPAHIPITRMDPVKTPFEGILLITEAGLNVGVQIQGSRALQEILTDQFLELKHPTWSELISQVKLPRNAELSAPTAREVLRCVNEQTKLTEKLKQILATCLEF
ncbi:MAG: hypothetical protein KA715_10180 [Xanthomonadaceae bacterium]|nr:hypothetical protein [Xanthomonadaceae bacterium]